MFRRNVKPEAGAMAYYARDFDSWEDIVQFVQSTPELKDYLFLGIAGNGELKFIKRSLLYANAQFVGRTRSGKTALAAMALAVQEMRRKETGLFYIDLKGGAAEFHTLRIEAEKAGLPFRYVTTEGDRASHGYFPLKQVCFNELSQPDQVQAIVQATGVNQSDTEPGTAYFGFINERTISGALAACDSEPSFPGMLAATEGPGAHKRLNMLRRDFENSGAAISRLAQLADCPQLNGGSPSVEKASLDIAKSLTEPHVTYVRGPVIRTPSLARSFVRFLATQIAAAARAIGGAKVQQILMFDEYQGVADPITVGIIKQCVDSNISCWVGHQNFTDLEQGPNSLLDQVSGNVAVRVMFSADRLGKKHLQEVCGERIRRLNSRSESVTENAEGLVSVGVSSSTSELIDKQISDEDVLHLNRTARLGTVEAYPSEGLSDFCGPTFLQFEHMMSHDEYLRRKAMPWPAVNEHTMLGNDVLRKRHESAQHVSRDEFKKRPANPQQATSTPQKRKRKRKHIPPLADAQDLQQLLWDAAQNSE